MRTFWQHIIFVIMTMASATAHGAEVQVAVAANFTGPMEMIVPLFQQATGHKAVVAYGTVGKFYAQIKNGAPFEVLVSADEATPRRLEEDGLAIAASRMTYAVGKLVLWSTPTLLTSRAQSSNGEISSTLPLPTRSWPSMERLPSRS
jgi:ABC-type molybdate transport system substrate-binding protein